MSEVREWMESLGWQAVTDSSGELKYGYNIPSGPTIDSRTATAYWQLREEYPAGPPRF
jgi:hypothetical protein